MDVTELSVELVEISLRSGIIVHLFRLLDKGVEANELVGAARVRDLVAIDLEKLTPQLVEIVKGQSLRIGALRQRQKAHASGQDVVEAKKVAAFHCDVVVLLRPVQLLARQGPDQLLCLALVRIQLK